MSQLDRLGAVFRREEHSPPVSHRHPLRSRSAALFSPRFALVIAAVAGTAAVATGCAAGDGAETLQIRPNFAAGPAATVQALDMVVVVDPATGTAQVTGTVVNNGDQPAHAVRRHRQRQVRVRHRRQPGPRRALGAEPGRAERPEDGAANSGSVPGHNSPVALSFASGAAISVAASTESNTGIYQQFQPSSAS